MTFSHRQKVATRSYETNLMACCSYTIAICLWILFFNCLTVGKLHNTWHWKPKLKKKKKKSVKHWQFTACTGSYSDKDPAWSKHVFLRFLNILSIPSIVLNTPALRCCALSPPTGRSVLLTGIFWTKDDLIQLEELRHSSDQTQEFSNKTGGWLTLTIKLITADGRCWNGEREKNHFHLTFSLTRNK